jgi:hypothetical protein
MRMVLTGGSGFVGSEVLAQLLAAEAITRVTCLSRRPLAMAHPKLVALQLDDFTRYDPALPRLQGALLPAGWDLAAGLPLARAGVRSLGRVGRRFGLRGRARRDANGRRGGTGDAREPRDRALVAADGCKVDG